MWASRKQSMVTLSSTEAEYIALTEAAKKAIWISRILKDLNQVVAESTVFYENNHSCIHQRLSQRTKHTDTKNHFVQELFQSKVMDIEYCASEIMLANLLTKPTDTVKTRQLIESLGLT
jgi:hypothetical protein